MKALILCLLMLLCSDGVASQWTAEMVPKPWTSGGSVKCKLKSAGLLCDPDSQLNGSQREVLNKKLLDIKIKTRNGANTDQSCKSQGLTVMIAIVNRIGATLVDPYESLKAHTNELRDKLWNKGKCEKIVVIFESVADRKIYTAYQKSTQLHCDSPTRSLERETSIFGAGHHYQGLNNMVDYYTTVYCTCSDGNCAKYTPAQYKNPSGFDKSTECSDSCAGSVWTWLGPVLGVLGACCVLCACCWCYATGRVGEEGCSGPESGRYSPGSHTTSYYGGGAAFSGGGGGAVACGGGGGGGCGGGGGGGF